ncbi:MAG: pyroglutamyl-peptidase I [Planctomycetes bacterium]|nr:pyroglutamyl-peptidase I [Planctomycetota bacterium]
MPSVLLTAFEPYGPWPANASWLCLQELTRELPTVPALTTRLYPVDFAKVRERLASDLEAGFDYALHLGQDPGSTHVQLEMFGLNIGGERTESPAAFQPLEAAGPAAYHSALPLFSWAAKLQQSGIPARVSFHAGTYLCNATLYWNHCFCERLGRPTRAAFIHLPLETSQAAAESRPMPSLPATVTAAAVRIMLSELAGPEPV